MSKLLLPIALVATTLLGAQDIDDPAPIFEIKEEAARIEYTASSGEAVVVFEAESETVMRAIQITKPDGTPVMRLWAGSEADSRISGFIIETGEQTASGLLEQYGPGMYGITARNSRGLPAEGGAQLTHFLLPAPTVLYPQDGELGVLLTPTITWLPDPNATEYRIVLEQDENDGLTARLPAGSNSFDVPAGILRPGTLSHVEIGAVAEGGNITFVEVEFQTL